MVNRFSFILGLLLGLAAFVSQPRAQIVDVGVIGVSGEGPFYIAMEKGYF